ncbi:hypothetical protein BaRGS_00016206 [Batillaria attramentaria]|uniref:Uncharacterized protein n=1 Tax=Batillaria attramentaria TaxID=370345 RepID=A0ABD0KZM4_9CAEN
MDSVHQETGVQAPGTFEADRKQALEAFQLQLRPYPHLFQLEKYKDLTSARLNSIRDKVLGEREQKLPENDYSKMERSRDSNLVAFIHFLLGDTEKALNETENTLRGDPQNLVTLADKATFMWLTGQIPAAEKELETLTKLRSQEGDFSTKETEAKAEMAYCYSRMGIPYASHAVKLFQEVVRERPEEYDWKLGLAMTLRRFTNSNVRIFYRLDTESLKEKVVEALSLLKEVKNEASASDDLRAHAAAELGKLLSVQSVKQEMPDVLRQYAGEMTAVSCFREASTLAPNNMTVISLSGGFLCSLGSLAESRKILKDALRIRETSVLYCQLGCTYLALIRQKGGPISREDKYVKKALKYFKKSVKLAYGESTRAHFNLGTMYRELGEFDKALEEFGNILQHQQSVGSPLETIFAYKQSGLITLELSKQEEDADKRKHLKEEAAKFLHITLDILCRNAARVPSFNPYFSNAWKSLHALIQAGMSDSPQREQLKENARLLHMIKDHSATLDVLRKLSTITERQDRDPEFVEMELKCYIKQNEFQDAVSFLELLAVTDHRERTSILRLQTYLLAGRHMLKTAKRKDGFDLDRDMARKYFRWAFELTYPTTSPNTDGEELNEEEEAECDSDWHVMILHEPDDPDMEAKAGGLKAVLREVCGLRITCMSDDVHPGALELFGVEDNMEKSRLLLVVMGDKEPSFSFLQGYLAPAEEMLLASSSQSQCRQQLLVVTTETGQQVPRQLRRHRSRSCPSTLFTADAAEYVGTRGKTCWGITCVCTPQLEYSYGRPKHNVKWTTDFAKDLGQGGLQPDQLFEEVGPLFTTMDSSVTNVHELLKPYPHLFQLQNYNDLTRARLGNIRDRVTRERDERRLGFGYSKLERSRDSNLIAFTCYLLGDYETAKRESEEVLKEDPNNIVALANLTVFVFEKGSRVEAENWLRKLQKLSCTDEFMVKAVEGKAEMAYCYSRMGPSYTDFALQLFKEVVEKRPQEFHWKFGFALALHRAVRPNQRMSPAIARKTPTQTAQQAIDFFLEVKKYGSDKLRARAAVELGLMLTKSTGKDYHLQGTIKSYCRSLSVTADKCFEEARRLDPNDASILTKYGQFFFRTRRRDKAQEMLEKAVSIRPTTTAHHILGLLMYSLYRDMQRSQSEGKAKNKPRNRRSKQNRKVANSGRPDSETKARYAEAAEYHFQKSIELAHGDNTTARVHLGQLHMSSGRYHKALDQFWRILGDEVAKNSPSDRITAYELSGLCKLSLSEQEDNDRNKQELKEEGHQLLKVALTLQCLAAERVPTFKVYFGKYWQSFHTLMLAVQRDGSASVREKQKERAKLLHMIGEHAHCLQILEDLSNYTKEEAEDPTFLHLKLNCFLRAKRYDEAVFFLSLLDTTNQLHHIENSKQLRVQTFILAARQTLLRHGLETNENAQYEIARTYFLCAFELRYQENNAQECTSTANGTQYCPPSTVTFAEGNEDLGSYIPSASLQQGQHYEESSFRLQGNIQIPPVTLAGRNEDSGGYNLSQGFQQRQHDEELSFRFPGSTQNNQDVGQGSFPNSPYDELTSPADARSPSTLAQQGFKKVSLSPHAPVFKSRYATPVLQTTAAVEQTQGAVRVSAGREMISPMPSGEQDCGGYFPSPLAFYPQEPANGSHLFPPTGFNGGVSSAYPSLMQDLSRVDYLSESSGHSPEGESYPGPQCTWRNLAGDFSSLSLFTQQDSCYPPGPCEQESSDGVASSFACYAQDALLLPSPGEQGYSDYSPASEYPQDFVNEGFLSTPGSQGYCDSDYSREDSITELESHAIILYDPYDLETETKASKIKSIFKNVYGLSVTCMSEGVHPGADERSEVLNHVERSRLLVVLIGADHSGSFFRQAYLEPAIESLGHSSLRRLLVLLTESDTPPTGLNLSGVRCPPALFELSGDGNLTAEHVHAICDLFCKMVDVSIEHIPDLKH